MSIRSYSSVGLLLTSALLANIALASTQRVTPVPATQGAAPNESISIMASYSTSDPCDENVTGLGLRVHWDSSQLSFASVVDVFQDELVAQGPVEDDTADLDGNPATDRFAHLAWADIDGRWTGTPCDLETRLFEINFTATPEFLGTATVGFTASSTAAGWDFAASPAEIWDKRLVDTDGDGILDIDDLDDDNDGIPDETEVAWGLDPLSAADGAADSDYDGKSDRQEYEDGTDPFYPETAASRPGLLTYVPVQPCRIVNTLGSTAGALQPDVARNLLAWGSAAELAAQGGRDDCPHPKQAEGLPPVAIAANVTAVGKQASGNGNIVAYPAGGSDPGASLVNFTTAANIANATVVKLCDPAACDRDSVGDGDFALEANFATVPAIVDVQGYFYPKELHNSVAVAAAGGDYTSPLAAVGALRKLVDDNDGARPSAANPYVVRLGPGTYTLGAQPLQLLPGVTLRGSGQGVTVLRGLGSADGGRGVVQGADGAVLRELRVEAMGDGTGYAVALLNDNASPRLERVTLVAAGATTNLAVLNRNGAQVQLERVEALATGGTDSAGLRCEGAGGAVLNRVTLRAGGAAGSNRALDNGAGCALQARNSLLDGDVQNDNAAAPVMLRASRLIGSPGGTGSFVCVGVVDAGFVPLDGACEGP